MFTDSLIRQGKYLFRWRSYTPLLMIPLLFIAAPESARNEPLFGETVCELWTGLCMLVALLAIGFRAAAVGTVTAGTSGRNRHGQVAHSLNTTGVYSIVRHPLYLGNFIGLIAVLASMRVWWVVVIGGLIYWLALERIIATEESFLKSSFGDLYTRWASRTPTFIPNFKLWKPSEHTFSWRIALRQEYSGIFTMGASFLLVEAIMDLYGEGMTPAYWFREDWQWFVVFGMCLLTLTVLRTLKKSTRLLEVKGR